MKSTTANIKTTILLWLTISVSLAASAQLQEMETSNTNWITKGEIKWLGKTKASLKYFVSNRNTTYLLYMQDEQKLKNNRDMTVVQYFSITFSGIDNAANNLYELLNSFFTQENRNNKKLQKIVKLGNEMVHVQHYGKLTGPAIMLSTKENHILFTQKELKRLFGR